MNRAQNVPLRTIVLHLNAGNDRNGNPRRLFLVFDAETGVTLDAIDEGYNGRSAWQKHFPDATELGQIETTPGEYRNILRQFKKSREF